MEFAIFRGFNAACRQSGILPANESTCEAMPSNRCFRASRHGFRRGSAPAKPDPNASNKLSFAGWDRIQPNDALSSDRNFGGSERTKNASSITVCAVGFGPYIDPGQFGTKPYGGTTRKAKRKRNAKCKTSVGTVGHTRTHTHAHSLT